MILIHKNIYSNNSVEEIIFMSKRSIYDFFIGLLALMISLMLVIEIFINIPNTVSWTFYYIDNIVRLIFIMMLYWIRKL